MKKIQTAYAISAHFNPIAPAVRTIIDKALTKWALILPFLLLGLSSPKALAKADLLTVAPMAIRAKGDSLFHLKQYTQSLELFQSLFHNRQYSPAMLLKMAYIEEGLGHIAQTQYYLNLYYLATFDPLALNKIQDLANKNRLEGYDSSDRSRLVTLLKEYYYKILLASVSVCIFFTTLLAFQKLKRHRRPVIPALGVFIFVCLLFALTWFHNHSTEGILSNSSTYLMEGPSAGAPVIAIVSAGHRLEILGKKDVWIRVRWMEREVYVRENDLLPVKL